MVLSMEMWKRVVAMSLFSAIGISGMTIYLYFTHGILDILGLKLITLGLCAIVVFLLVLMAIYAWKNPEAFSMFQEG